MHHCPQSIQDVPGISQASGLRSRLPTSLLALLLLILSLQAKAADPKVAAILQRTDALVAGGPFQADWKSLENYRVPDWHLDAKFGIFIHLRRSSAKIFLFSSVLYLQILASAANVAAKACGARPFSELGKLRIQVR